MRNIILVVLFPLLAYCQPGVVPNGCGPIDVPDGDTSTTFLWGNMSQAVNWIYDDSKDSLYGHQVYVYPCRYVLELFYNPDQTFKYSKILGIFKNITYSGESNGKDTFNMVFDKGDWLLPEYNVRRGLNVTITCDKTAAANAQIDYPFDINFDSGMASVSVTTSACGVVKSEDDPFPFLSVDFSGTMIILEGMLASSGDPLAMDGDNANVTVTNTDTEAFTAVLRISSTNTNAVTPSILGLNPAIVEGGSSFMWNIQAPCTGSGRSILTFELTISQKRMTFESTTFLISKSCGVVNGGGRSVGGFGIFVICVFVGTIVFCGGGYAYKYQQMGLRGVEAVPLIDPMRAVWLKMRDMAEHRAYTRDSVISMEVRPASTAAAVSGYQDVE